ncbi:MAG: queC 3 [Gemmataceae bacterium]|nr:queC 3 [Gemmataceae bacterium]
MTSIPANPVASWPPTAPATPLAVLVSGGLDSAVLLAEAVRVYPAVYPLYVRTGLLWEPVERRYLDRFLAAVRSPVLRPLHVLDQPAGDVYGPHWSVTGEGVPDAAAPNDADFLPGRNVLLLAKPLIWCHLNGVPELATAPLASNPFPDATPEFYDRFAAVVSSAVGGRVTVIRPYAHLHKPDVLRRARGLPLEHTFSCVRPVGDLPCGRCIKCGERRRGFREAGMADPTRYAG